MEGTTVQLVRSHVAETYGENWFVPETLHSLWKRIIAYFVSKIDDDVEQIFRVHNQEATHLANLGTEGQKQIAKESRTLKSEKPYEASGKEANKKMAEVGASTE